MESERPDIPAFVPSAHHSPVLVYDWRDAEEFAIWHATWVLGFGPVVPTASGADEGVDLRGPDLAGQVKHHRQPVGRPDIQRLQGASGTASNRLFYSLAGYTYQAVVFADKHGVALYTYTIYGGSNAESESARNLLDSAPQRRGFATEQERQDVERRADEEAAERQEQAQLLREAESLRRLERRVAEALDSDPILVQAEFRALKSSAAVHQLVALANDPGSDSEQLLAVAAEARDQFRWIRALLLASPAAQRGRELPYALRCCDRALQVLSSLPPESEARLSALDGAVRRWYGATKVAERLAKP